MGRTRRPQPKKLKKKLRDIRLKLELTQDEMAKQLHKSGSERAVHSGYVADFESGKREPSLLVILAYAKLIGASTDVLINDEMELPKRLVWVHGLGAVPDLSKRTAKLPIVTAASKKSR